VVTVMNEVARRESVMEPLVVRPRDACKMLSIGRTKLYELLNDGEIESYRHGRSRRIALASIRAFISRQIDDAPATRDRRHNHGEPRTRPYRKGISKIVS
jgi:excisionase family DNA binding protein